LTEISPQTHDTTAHVDHGQAIEYHWVLGAAGFVGKQVVLELLKQFEGNPLVQIVAVGHEKIDVEIMERTHFLMTAIGALESKWLDRFPPKYVFHCARNAGRSDRARFSAAKKGERANRRLKRQFESLSAPPIVVYCSGTLMYGNAAVPVDESTPENPIAYARAYERAERPWKEGSDTIDIRIAYPAWVFGAGSWFEAFYLRPAIQSKTTYVLGSGAGIMNLIHVRDVAGQLIHIALQGTPGQRYNIYGNEATTQEHFAHWVAQIAESELKNLSESELKQKFGVTVTEALTSSIVLSTLHQEWKSTYPLKFPHWKPMVEEVINTYLRKS
jgi:nucleoside-diphosphate-sugar epimerase